MPANKRRPDQIRRDRAIVARLYLQGYTMAEVTRRLNAGTEEDRDYSLSLQQIAYDIGKIREAWLESALVDIDQRKAEELKKLDALEHEYWVAWRRSLQDETTITTESSEDEDGRVKRTVKASSGDPRFLQGIERCINRRIELFGLDAPKRTEAVITETKIRGVFQLDNLSVQELDRLEAILSKALPGPVAETGPSGSAQRGQDDEGTEESDLLYGDDVLEVPGRELP